MARFMCTDGSDRTFHIWQQGRRFNASPRICLVCHQPITVDHFVHERTIPFEICCSPACVAQHLQWLGIPGALADDERPLTQVDALRALPQFRRGDRPDISWVME